MYFYPYVIILKNKQRVIVFMDKENVHSKHRERLRQRYLTDGIDSFQAHEILELILFYAIARKDTNELAHKLLNKFGNISNVLEASPNELMSVDGIGEGTAVYLNMYSQILRKYFQDKKMKKAYINSTKEAGDYCIDLFYGRIYECFYVIGLNSQNKVIHCEKMVEGIVDETVIYPRNIARTALNNNFVKVIITHNHPGGTPYPSTEDLTLTREISQALTAVGVKLFDHIIVCDEEYISLAKEKLL